MNLWTPISTYLQLTVSEPYKEFKRATSRRHKLSRGRTVALRLLSNLLRQRAESTRGPRRATKQHLQPLVTTPSFRDSFHKFWDF